MNNNKLTKNSIKNSCHKHKIKKMMKYLVKKNFYN